MTKLRLTLTVDYEADPKDYPRKEPDEMALQDQSTWESDDLALMEFLEWVPHWEIKVEPV